MNETQHIANQLYAAATPVIKIHEVGGRLWKRNVAKGSRIGPWLQANYSILNQDAWVAYAPCLYMVAGPDGGIRYVGISRNRLKDRWRVSPALDAQTGARLPENQLFHSQCWQRIQAEPGAYEIRCITGHKLLSIITAIGGKLAGFAPFNDDHESLVNCVERWLCNRQADGIVPWNSAMTG